MNTENLIEEIKKQLTGDPQKDGPFLKEQSEKYKNEENSEEINRELAKLLYECTRDSMTKNIYDYFAQKSPEINDKLTSVLKRYKNLNFNGGIDILQGIIKENIFAWNDDDQYTYKSFGTPVEHALYMQIYQPEKTVRPTLCNMSEVYSLYGWGLTKKERYTEAIDAFKKALDFNPTDPEIYIRYCELLKNIHQLDELKVNTDKLMHCAVTKEQLGKGYFNYSYYFSEKNDFDKAAAMLEMSRIFLGDSNLIKSEFSYIAQNSGRQIEPHTQQQLMSIMIAENIQPGPSALVISVANFLAQNAERELEYDLALYYYEIVWELTELDDIMDRIDELKRTIKNLQ